MSDFDPQRIMRRLTDEHGVSEELFALSRTITRYYAIERPLRIGLMSGRKRLEAFDQLVAHIDAIREEAELSNVETSMLLLRLVMQDSRCRQAMEEFHVEYHGPPETNVGLRLDA